ncbi:MaoC/PaaZ C-terminal domain-containing protein [Psychrobacter sp. HD31]|uniref:MaoC family dehydratase n=1 Tax=Psychrobacter sp. HD31 TaxID=3112003 RepID=UPI003DA52D89
MSESQHKVDGNSSKNFKELPRAHTTYANIVKSLLPKSDAPKVSKDELPSFTYKVDTLTIDSENLNDYRKICGFDKNNTVPITYFAVLSQSLQMNMMAKEAFPFAMLGLVHVDNSVTQYRKILDNEVFAMSVDCVNLRDHDKGQQFDFVTQVKAGDELIWEGVSTYLSRSRSKNRDRSKTSKQTTKLSIDSSSLHTYFKVAEDMGRRYAFVSGDFNLIHLHPLSARAFGFPKAIAHGMWSKAKCLSYIKNLPEAYRVDVSFKTPIFLPSEVELIVADEVDKKIEFGLYCPKNDSPHALGVISLLDHA